MSDAKRLESFREALNETTGLDVDTYQHLLTRLAKGKTEFGYDERGRLKVAIFDSKDYDIDSLEMFNDDRFLLRFLTASLDADTAATVKGYRAICIFVNDTCNAEVINTLAENGVELIALRATGYNNVDLEACRKAGISVVRVSAYSPYAIAEHTVGLMLTLNRHLHRAYLRVLAGNFSLGGLTGFDMHGRTVGVLGTGKIGQHVIDILLGFGCHVLAVDAYQNETVAAMKDVTYVPMEEMFARSDIITMHVPLLSSTQHVIDHKAIEQMKPGVMIINTSRGGLIDSKALIDGLKSGQIGAAGLDVYEEEAGIFFEDMSSKMLTDDHLARLLSFNNVVVTSHQAFLTAEALADIAQSTMLNLQEFQDGKRGEELTNAVTS